MSASHIYYRCILSAKCIVKGCGQIQVSPVLDQLPSGADLFFLASFCLSDLLAIMAAPKFGFFVLSHAPWSDRSRSGSRCVSRRCLRAQTAGVPEDGSPVARKKHQRPPDGARNRAFGRPASTSWIGVADYAGFERGTLIRQLKSGSAKNPVPACWTSCKSYPKASPTSHSELEDGFSARTRHR